MKIDEILALVDFRVKEAGCLEIECYSYAVAVEVWGKRQTLASSYLRPFHHVKTVKILVSGNSQYPTIKLERTNPMNISQELIQEALTIGMALKASVFLIHYDGTYLEYLEAGHPGKTIVSYEEMIGQKAMDKLPDPMRQVVIHFHNKALITGQTQHFIYQSPLTKALFREILVPYPEHQIVVHFVTPAPPDESITVLSKQNQFTL